VTLLTMISVVLNKRMRGIGSDFQSLDDAARTM